MADRKLKITRDMGEGKTESKTIGNINPEADNEALLTTANQLAGLQNNTVKTVECIDTTVISG